MKDVVTAAPDTVLVTGFGPFPGAPSNPTTTMLDGLAVRGVEGVRLALVPLPVTFTGVAPALRAAAVHRPRAILLLGLARRRTVLSVETGARNRLGLATPDAGGAVPDTTVLVADGPDRLAASWPADFVHRALLAQGYDARLSGDAGDYVCNAALYHALHEDLAPTIGFLHVPPLGCRGDGAPTIETLTEAARIAIAVMAPPDVAGRYSAATSAG